MCVQGFSLVSLLTLSDVVMPESPSAQISLPVIDIALCFVPGTTRLPAQFEGQSEGLMTGENSVWVQEESREESVNVGPVLSAPQQPLTEPV